MLQRILQTAFGLGVGVAARLLLPGHHSVGMLTTAVLSLAGAVGGELAAEKFLPPDTLHRAGFIVAAIGALAALLLHAIAV